MSFAPSGLVGFARALTHGLRPFGKLRAGCGLHSFAASRLVSADCVSESNVAAVTEYIALQEEQHKKQSFQQEYVAFLEKNHVEYDERYILGLGFVSFAPSGLVGVRGGPTHGLRRGLHSFAASRLASGDCGGVFSVSESIGGVFSVSEPNVVAVTRYIAGQEEHQ